jgi:hypothetical protein
MTWKVTAGFDFAIWFAIRQSDITDINDIIDITKSGRLINPIPPACCGVSSFVFDAPHGKKYPSEPNIAASQRA